MSDLEKLRREFLEESEETLNRLQRDVSQLAETGDPIAADVLDRAFRTAHSLKGVCGMFGLDDMLLVAHALENAFEALRSGVVALSAPLVDILFQGVETLHDILAHETGEREKRPEEEARAFADRVDALLEAERPSRGPGGDPLEELLARLVATERAAVEEAARESSRLAIVETVLPEEGFEAGLRDLLDAAGSWGCVHGTISEPPEAGAFRVLFLVSGPGEIFHLMKAVGPHGAEVSSCDAKRVLAVPEPTQEPAAPEDRELQVRPAPAGAGTLRVPVHRVDRLLTGLGDVIHARMSVDASAEPVVAVAPDRLRRTEFTQALRHLDRRIRTLQDGVLSMRMVGLGALFQKLERTLRDACRVAAKEARLVTRGEEVELDKTVVDALVEPLVHLVRNAVDHGLEEPAERGRLGKEAVGTVTVSARSRAGTTILEVSDDGAGLDLERILTKARQAGIVGEDEEVDPAALRELIFRPGFTVKDEATALSGRGVGLDAVREAARALGGALSLEEDEGRTLFRMRIPTTLAVTQALLVEALHRPYYLPLAAVDRVLHVARADLERHRQEEVLLIDDEVVPVRELGVLLGERPAAERPDRTPAVLLRVAGAPVVLLVDRVGRQREIVIRSLGRLLSWVPGVSGSTELEDGRTVLLLDPAALDPGACPVPAGGAR